MRFDHGVSVTVHRTTQDRWGNVTTDVSHTIGGCGIAPRASSEDTDRRDTVATGVALLAPPGADLRATDVVELPDGTRWSVSGDPRRPQSPFTGWAPGVRAELERVTG